jgi:Arc/MetJ-type ribon-helix-helix transcriptional regulator
MPKNESTIPISTRITNNMQRAIKRILLSDGHLNVADYMRDLIREDLEKRGLLEQKKEVQTA